MDETPHQRKWRLVAERQAARNERERNREVQAESDSKAWLKWRNNKEARRERKYLEYLISDHNHEMDG